MQFSLSELPGISAINNSFMRTRMQVGTQKTPGVMTQIWHWNAE